LFGVFFLPFVYGRNLVLLHRTKNTEVVATKQATQNPQPIRSKLKVAW
jgi:hypothetical protein